MDEFFLPQTGDEKMDEAYKKVAAMVDTINRSLKFLLKKYIRQYIIKWRLIDDRIFK